MRITDLKVYDFLAIHQAKMKLAQLTMVYAGNGSGKTSLMDALRFALVGEACRNYTLSGLIKRGAKHTSVEAVLAGATPDAKPTSIMRDITASGQVRFYNGVEIKGEEMATEIAKLLRCGPVTLDAALRADALLEQPAADLQRLLLRLTGAKIDAAAIAAAFDAAVLESVKRTTLALPESLEQFASCCKAAEEARKIAKRTATSLEADLARLPVPNGPAADAARAKGTTLETLQQALADASTQHTAAVATQARTSGEAAGAKAERLRALQARQTELRAVEKPRGTAAEAQMLVTKLEAAAVQRAAVEQRLVQARQTAQQARQAAPAGIGAPPPAPVDPTPIRIDLAAARVVLEGLERVGKETKARLDSANVEGCSHSCKVHCVDVEKEQGCYAASKGAYAEQRKVVRKLEKDLAAAEATQAAAQADGARAQALVVAAEAEEAVKRLETEAAALPAADPAAIAKAQTALNGHKAHQNAEAELRRVATEIEGLAAAPEPAAPTAVDPAPIAAKMESIRYALEARGMLDRRAEVEAKLVDARLAIEDADAIAQACGPKGTARVKLYAQALAPFVTACSEALAIVATGYEMALDTAGDLAIALRKNGEIYPVSAISRGEVALLQYALQYAVARLAGVGVLIFDHAENIDEDRRTAFKKLIARCLKDGAQVLLLSCTKPPAKAPKGTAFYTVVDGTVVEVAP